MAVSFDTLEGLMYINAPCSKVEFTQFIHELISKNECLRNGKGVIWGDKARWHSYKNMSQILQNQYIPFRYNGRACPQTNFIEIIFKIVNDNWKQSKTYEMENKMFIIYLCVYNVPDCCFKNMSKKFIKDLYLYAI